MHLTGRDGISILQLIVYVPFLVIIWIACWRHGFRRSAGWVLILIFCLLRIVGSICELCARSHPSKDLIIAVVVLDSIGISPLMLATLGLLSRLTNLIRKEIEVTLEPKLSRLTHIVVSVAVILSIVGSASSSDPNHPKSTSRVGVCLYLAALAGCVLLLALSWGKLRHCQNIPRRERLAVVVVGIASPLLLIRIVYSASSVLANSSVFNLVKGSISAKVCMAVIEEIIIVVMYASYGWYLNPLKDVQGASPL
ncbi:hypothetical protein BDV38DRAFT_279310 [Aspergillus pseudotamarii]|uniref:DUF7702 domain-containing protein n=1 Tax=Aspergillus pseudotamarii TaxID=132259 RepID=A0A5N6T545_ASPPS|nr:uncharacterized protein BDV38DRAFT_279310 [Aspergillus pseudotamarii]KAE8141410.1 hypothetical protein BDV38DRAFT_279310 [Aspergillus pseudotamarii]